MRVKRTEQIWIKSNENISSLCYISKNLYNKANYLIRQKFFENGRWVRYNELDKELKESENYKSLPAQTVQQVLRLLDKSWKFFKFFKAMRVWSKEPEKFKARPKTPKYKKKDGEHILVLTNQQCKIREDGSLKFPRLLGLDVKTRLNKETNLREVRVIPKSVGYAVEIVYEKEVNPEDLDKNRVAGIDLGVRNLVTMGNNIGERPIVVKGGICKSINQFYNKEMGRIQRIYESQRIKMGRKSKKLFDKRNRKIKDYLHKVSRFIVDYCVKKNIGTVVIGNNEGWKQNANIGKKNNQNFVQIPFSMLINQIKYKAEEKGIKVILQEESHTSKCSFLDNERIEHHDAYLGKRFKRGLFRSAKGKIINADVNASLNLIRKAIPEAFARAEADGIEGIGLHPLRCYI
jgi:IS605 OrfB family transposase